MTLIEYLASPQAREDVKLLIYNSVGYLRVGHGTWNLGQQGAWRTALYHHNETGNDFAVYYRPDGERDRFIVTDLGGGVFRLIVKATAHFPRVLRA